ncbi:hypothetical protein TVAG_448770 [Trichomonas vaginalis G3]|uniref:Uncharacterized protein n=1 Tax=Trichomonas vaginalis (strain ATCC PRA-98 / G3) TaxID=412133 RepID=A2FZ32_TRIV3|nr:spectrin binding [Trichomonas vaginalis G3]EAX89846.1 hypothetical protein TVAG_448770 [Trichomonas vaginalis G3]KAI5512539.1 spectrin binding [Trichomonas vaginalis G3]|eukprot:XP_001302776.1 hypothetical protein [Trichomonas vaginalis G3]
MEEEIRNSKPLEVFEYPIQASNIIWEVDSSNLAESMTKIINLIKDKKIPVQMALYLIDCTSVLKRKLIAEYTEFYEKISKKFSIMIRPFNFKMAILLYYRGLKFDKFSPEVDTKYYETVDPQSKQEEILNIYSKDSPLYYIAWDKIDELKAKFPDIDINEQINREVTPLECAIQYGSELCFNYFRNLGAQYTKKCARCAIKGGNKNIIMQLIEDGQIFDYLIEDAFDYRNYELAEYLNTNFKQNESQIAEIMYFGNYEVVSYLLSQNADLKGAKFDILFLFIFIVVLKNSLSFNIFHCFILFSFF